MMFRNASIALFLSLTALPACAQPEFADEREFMVEQVVQLAELTGEDTGRPKFTDRVIDALRTVPRHEFVPFDAILVTAAPEEVPEPLIQQLKPGGRLVIPVGPENEIQSLQVLEKTESGQTRVTDVLPVRFVPFLDEDDVSR